MLFHEGASSLRLDIAGYEFPADWAGAGEERNWLVLRCVWRQEDGNIRKDAGSYLLTYELQELCAGLKVLLAGIKSAYRCDFMEPYFTLNASARKEGDFLVEVSFLLMNSMDGDDTAELACVMDAGELRALVEELDSLCRKYPPRL